MIQKRNDERLLSSLNKPYIVYIDNNITDGWTHLPHFMLVVGETEGFYSIFDSWEGKTEKNIQEGTTKQHLNYCVNILRFAHSLLWQKILRAQLLWKSQTLIVSHDRKRASLLKLSLA